MAGPSRSDYTSLYGEEEGGRRYQEHQDRPGPTLGRAMGDVWDAATGQVDYRPGLGRVQTGRIDQSRGNSLGLQNQLALAASGQGGPSAAQQQLQAGTQAGLRQQLAMAASARGGAAQQAAARRQGMANAAMQQGQASNEAAALRAREQQAAQAQLAGLSTQQQQVDLGEQEANLQAQTQNNQQRMEIAQGNAKGKQGVVGSIMSAAGGLLMSDIRGKESIQPMTGYEQAQQFAPAALPSRPEPVQQAPQQQAAPAGDSGLGGMLSGILSDENSKAEIRSLRSQLDAVTKEADAMRASPPATGGVSESLRRLSTPEGSRAGLAPVEPYQYRYKPAAAAAYGEDTAPRAGVMAQELEESPYLRSAVVQQPNGQLGIDGSRGLSASLAAAAGLDKRLRAIEATYPQTRAPSAGGRL
jgi:hypothetical protein